MKKKRDITIIVTMLLMGLFVFSPLCFKQLVPSGKSTIESINLISQIIMSFFAVFGVLVALWQYIIYTRRELDQKDKEIFDMNKERIQKAIDMSGYFKDNVINLCGPILFLYDNTKVSRIMEKLSADKLNRFDKQEMQLLLNEKDIKEMEKLKYSDEFCNTLTSVCIVDEKWKECAKVIEVMENDKIINKIQIDKSILKHKYGKTVDEIMNNLEYFAMHFIYETAEESVVYQSLHIAYLDLVCKLYYEISKDNNGSCERKYYTNITKLFLQWREEAIKQRNEELAVTDKFVREGKKLKIQTRE